MEIKGIKYIAPFFDGSGYAQASRSYVLALYKLGIPITISATAFENQGPDLGKNGLILHELVDKEIDYNIVITQLTPEFWREKFEDGKFNIGYTVWETDKLHPSWPSMINKADTVLCSSQWNVEVFKKSGVIKPVYCVPHGIDLNEIEPIESIIIDDVDPDAYKFHSVFQFCYDKETRVLTADGFKYFKDLNYDDEIATLNLKTEGLEYQKPTNIVKFKRKDKMLTLRGAFFDMCVTPNHKMVVRDKNSSDWNLVPFNDLLSRGKLNQLIVSEKYRAKKNCKWIGEDKPTFKVPMLEKAVYPIREGISTDIDMDVFLEFMGWYLSEGSTYASKRGYRNTITQYKEKYRSEIISCIEKMGYTVVTTPKDIIFNSREMHNYLKQFGKCNEKFIPKWIKNLSSRQISILLNSLFKGDGSLYEDGGWVKYTTTSKQLSEDIQECLLKVGMSGAISIESPILKTPGKIEDREIQGRLLQYVISVNKYRNEPSMYYADLEEVDYDDYIYCATVPNHAMLVERNGKVIFSGNTERKHPIALIKSYWAAFQNRENVALILQTYRSGFEESEKNAIRSTIKKLKEVSPSDWYPPIHLLLDMPSRKDIFGLHKFSDCFISLNRGEGFGLTPFEAGACGRPIIVTGMGGVLEYANPDNSYLVNYTWTPVSGMPWSPWYRVDQLWAEPDCLDAINKMCYVYNNRQEAIDKGIKLKNFITKELSIEAVGKKMIDVIKSL